MKVKKPIAVVKKQKSPKKPSSLYKTLYGSYDKSPKNHLADEGYELDAGLSNHNQQVYYNREKKKLVTAVTGTHNLSDVLTDVTLFTGGLKHTKRYKEADKVLRTAKQKYQPQESTVVGHSLGGAIAKKIGSKSDRIITYNSGHLTKAYTLRKNETAIHTRGDPLSALGPSTHVISSSNYNPHSVDHLRNFNDVPL